MGVAVHHHAQVASHSWLEGVLLDGCAWAAAIALEQVSVAFRVGRALYQEMVDARVALGPADRDTTKLLRRAEVGDNPGSTALVAPARAQVAIQHFRG